MHEQTARRVAAECGVPAYTRVQALVANERLDAAAISTPGDSHHAIGAYLAGARHQLHRRDAHGRDAAPLRRPHPTRSNATG